ncbi:hypothetical protein QBC45DRAFT_401160, partial [Copromyces sp. CBS 386.78]
MLKGCLPLQWLFGGVSSCFVRWCSSLTIFGGLQATGPSTTLTAGGGAEKETWLSYPVSGTSKASEDIDNEPRRTAQTVWASAA